MRQILKKAGRIFFTLGVVAFIINIILLIFANFVLTGTEAFELATLSLINMMLLSFVLLREPNQKAE